MRRNFSATKYYTTAKDICDQKGYTLITPFSNDITGVTKIKFECPLHGEQTMQIYNLVNGHECIRCSYEKRGKKLKYSQEYIKSEIDKVNNNCLLNPEDYVDVFTRNLNIRCSCGNVFTTSFGNYIKKSINRCHICSCKESSGEKRIREFFDKNGIKYEREKRFPDCRDNKSLPFDFYIPEKNTIIEFDGQHHYKDIDGYNNYSITNKHDNIKNEYCKKNGITLIRIPYWSGNCINEILTKELL